MDQIVIAHISDVHFGDQLFDPQISRWPPVMPHDPILCAWLKLALEDVHAEALLEKDESIDVVLTGDLSQRGSTTNFDTAHTYFHEWTLASPGTAGGIGIGLSLARLPMIPGNHDHWDGKWNLLPGPKAYDPKIFRKRFKQTPWHEQLASTKKGITLDLFGLDSNSGFAQNQTSLLAGGLISPKEFGKLESLLKAIPGSGKNNVRVILCHHALSRGRWPFPLVLSKASTAKLTRIVDRYRISAVLTGHTHGFF